MKKLMVLPVILLLILLVVSTIACTSGSSSHVQITYCAADCQTSWLGDGICQNACNNAACYYDNGDCSSAVPTSTVTKTATYTNPTLTPTTTNIPIQVELDYFGVACNSLDTGYVSPLVQLYVVVDDGKTSETTSLPPTDDGMSMNSFKMSDVGQRIFYTNNVGDYLRISVLAYTSEDKEAISAWWELFSAWNPELQPLTDYYNSLPQKQELLGWYEMTWYPSEGWGTVPGTVPGRYDAKGSGDLRLWFRIWSDTEPVQIAQPKLLPDVEITNINLPSEVAYCNMLYSEACNPYYNTFNIVNHEECPVTVTWIGHSSQTGDFDTGDSRTVLGGGNISVSKHWHYLEQTGTIGITYTFYYRQDELDSWSGTITVVQ